MFLFALFTAACGGGGGGGGGQTGLTRVASYSALVEGAPLNEATKARLRGYDAGFLEIPSVASFVQNNAMPFQGDYTSYPSANYPTPNGRFRFAVVDASRRELRQTNVDLQNGLEGEGESQVFIGCKAAESVGSGGAQRVPISIVSKLLILQNGQPYYEAFQLIEGFLLNYDISGGPSYPGTPGSLVGAKYFFMVARPIAPGTANIASLDYPIVFVRTSGGSGGGLPNDLPGYLSGVTSEGVSGVLTSGTVPAPTTSQTLGVSGSASAINGGTNSTSCFGSFDHLRVAVEGVAGYYEIAYGSLRSSATLVLEFGSNVPAATFRCRIAGGVGGQFGPFANRDFTLTSAGTGNLQVNLSWNSDADLDLYLVEPGPFTIFYGEPSSPNGGELDLDSNAGCTSGPRNENITYSSSAPSGSYTVRANNYEACGAAQSDYVVRINVAGQAPVVRTGSFTGTGSSGGASAGQVVYTFTR